MSDDNPYVIPEMDPTMRNQIQQCNWQVVNVTTPANYFHVLRRQVKILILSPLLALTTILGCISIYISLFSDTPRFQKAFNCDVSKEPPSSQGLQIQSI
jgi:hypothetical protein